MFNAILLRISERVYGKTRPDFAFSRFFITLSGLCQQLQMKYKLKKKKNLRLVAHVTSYKQQFELFRL